MRKRLFLNTLSAGLLFCFAGCSLDPYIITAEEEYTRAFIKNFGVIDPHMDWNMAKTDVVSVNLGSKKASSVKVYCLAGSKYYLIADIDKVTGTLEIPVDVPKDAQDIMVKVDGKKFFGNITSTIDCSGMSRGVPDTSSGSSYPDNPSYTSTLDAGSSTYSISVRHASQQDSEDMKYTAGRDGANYEYQYFNTRQISPIVSKTPWTQYTSLNTGSLSIPNTGNHIGLLPESGIYNRLASDIENWIALKQSEGYNMNIDFTFETNNEGKFVIFPFYYGTNLQHELGVYLVDDDGLPFLKSGGKAIAGNSSYTLDDFISFPIFKTRDHGDLQVQPHYDSRITGIRVNIDGSTDGNVYLNLGETFDLQQYVEVQLNNGEWTSYNTYITNNGAKTHSRVAYHLWVDEPKSASDPEPVVYATCDRDGIITPKALTNGHGHDNCSYGVVAIPTGMADGATGKGRVTGVQQNITFYVTTSDHTLEIDTSNLPSGVSYSAGVLSIPLGYNGDLPLIVKKNGTVVSPFDVSMININGNDNSTFTIYSSVAENKIKVRANAEGQTNASLKISNGTPLSFDICVTDPSSVTHTYSTTRNKWPGDLQYNVFVQYNVNLFTGNQNLNDYSNSITIPSSSVASAAAGNKIVVTFDANSGVEVQLGGMYDTDNDSSTDPTWVTLGGNWGIGASETSYELVLTDQQVNYIKSAGFQVQGKVTVTSVDLIVSDSGSFFNKSAAEAAIADYYKSNSITGTCSDHSDITLNSTDADVNISVSISSADSNNSITYTVTLSKKTTSMSAPRRRNAPMRVAAPASREGSFDMSSMLNEDNSIGWLDVSSYWTRNLRSGEEVASYPVDMDMLGRTRGYTVNLTVDGHAYYGKLGAYLKVLGSNDLNTDGSGYESTGEYTQNASTYPYTVFSQRLYNRAGTSIPYTTAYPQISAVSVIHPSSGDTFLSFEDMLVTHAGDSFAYYEKSSDRDVNDVIFKVYGLNTSKPYEEDDEGFPWILAVEDLGSTDDFDFNDLVLKISSVTKRLVTPAEDDDSDDTVIYLSKQIIFTPLAAGGTLPLYLQWNDYTLATGTYYLGDAAPAGVSAQPMSVLLGDATSVGQEIHSWFGNYSYSVMINTSGPGKPANSCTIYVPINESTGATDDSYNFTIAGFGAAKPAVDASQSGNNVGIKVYVDDARENQMGEITKGWTVSRPEEGKVSQMFIIYDTGNKWCWPKERVSIHIPYPKFNEWLSNPTLNWFETPSKADDVVSPRQD